MRASLALDPGRRTASHHLIARVAADPVAGPLFTQALRGNRAAYPALAAAIEAMGDGT